MGRSLIPLPQCFQWRPTISQRLFANQRNLHLSIIFVCNLSVWTLLDTFSNTTKYENDKSTSLYLKHSARLMIRRIIYFLIFPIFVVPYRKFQWFPVELFHEWALNYPSPLGLHPSAMFYGLYFWTVCPTIFQNPFPTNFKCDNSKTLVFISAVLAACTDIVNRHKH